MVDIKKLAQAAEKRKTIYPALEFSPGDDKHAEGSAIVRFLGALVPVENPKAKPGQSKEFLTVNVELLHDSDFGQRAGTYQLRTAATNTSLTDGILKIMNDHGGDLMDCVAEITTYNYNHPQHGRTRGYRVREVKSNGA